MSIHYTIEMLFHFACAKCKRWWSVGDYELIRNASGLIICPYCGHTALPEKDNEPPIDVN